MITWLSTGLLLLCAINYLIFTRKIHLGLGKLKSIEKVGNSYFPYVSVIVPARNEEDNIKDTLISIASQIYPKKKLQVILVNDRSTDRTPKIMSTFIKNYENFTKVDIDYIPPGISPKKNAINSGIMMSKGDIIITTDADCLHSPKWIQNMVKYFKPEVGLVAGLTIFNPDHKSLTQRLHSLDFLSHSFVGAGAIGAGDGMNCTGANLAYRRKAYIELKGFSKMANMVSGDDEFFLQSLIRKRKWKAVHAIGDESIVRSKPPETIKGIIRQRCRWGSKGLYYPLKIKLTAAGIFVFYLMLLIAPILVLSGSIHLKFFISFVVVKVLSDLMVMSRGCKIFGIKFPITDFILLSFIHPLLIIMTAIWGHFFSFQWKGESYRSKMPNKIENTN